MRSIKKKLEILDKEGVATVLCDILQLYTHYTTGMEIPFKDARHWVTLLGSSYRNKLPKEKNVEQIDLEEAIKREQKTFRGWKRNRKENGK